MYCTVVCVILVCVLVCDLEGVSLIFTIELHIATYYDVQFSCSFCHEDIIKLTQCVNQICWKFAHINITDLNLHTMTISGLNSPDLGFVRIE